MGAQITLLRPMAPSVDKPKTNDSPTAQELGSYETTIVSNHLSISSSSQTTATIIPTAQSTIESNKQNTSFVSSHIAANQLT